MKLTLSPIDEDFRNAGEYTSHSDCLLGTILKRSLPFGVPYDVGPHSISIGEDSFSFSPYVQSDPVFVKIDIPRGVTEYLHVVYAHSSNAPRSVPQPEDKESPRFVWEVEVPDGILSSVLFSCP